MDRFETKKKFGQNFLNDNNTISKISDLIDANQDDLIIEIGVGLGALTKYLVKKNSYYIGYEIDKDTIEYNSKYESTKAHIIYDDFLKRDLLDDIKKIKYKRLFIVGNLPYYITSQILLRVFKLYDIVYKGVFMVQLEFADRLSSKPGNKEYGSISVLANYSYIVKKELFVSRKLFSPSPRVDSAVISLTNKDREEVDYDKFIKFIRDAFQFKRKTLKNNLKSYDLSTIETILNKYDYSLSDRAENIPYYVYVDIVNSLKWYKKINQVVFTNIIAILHKVLYYDIRGEHDGNN